MIVKINVTHEGQQGGIVLQRDEKTGQVRLFMQGEGDVFAEGLELLAQAMLPEAGF